MRNRSLSLVVLVLSAALAAVVLAPAFARAATCKLAPKKRDSGQRVYQPTLSSPDWLFSIVDGQDVSAMLQPKTIDRDGKKIKTWAPDDAPWQQEFNKVVTKQPKKYNADFPYRGVVSLGDKKYGFVLDSPKDDGQRFGMLYFDLNGNGDLTDDPPIASNEAKQARENAEREKAEKEKAETAVTETRETVDTKKKDEKKAKARRRVVGRLTPYLGRGVSSQQFPAVDLAIEVAGKKADYRFFLSVVSYVSGSYGRVNVSLTPGMYYEGEIELDGRRQRVVLVDYNSNGRFDDVTKVIEARMSASGPLRYYPQRGDVLFLDPKPVRDTSAIWDATGLDFRHNIEKLICLSDRYYALKVAPAGDELSIEPADVATGYVTNPNHDYSVIIHGELGLLRISGTADQPIAVPEGEWKLMSYRIDLTNYLAAERKKKEEAEKKQKEEQEKKKETEEEDNQKTAAGGTDSKKPSFWAVIDTALEQRAAASAPAAARRAQRPRTTLVTAMGTTAGKPIKVVKGQTVTLLFGPPYRPTVEPSYFNQQSDTLYLGLEMYGSNGEAVTDLRVDGGRPPKPKVKILGPADEVASEGHFEYG